MNEEGREIEGRQNKVRAASRQALDVIRLVLVPLSRVISETGEL